MSLRQELDKYYVKDENTGCWNWKRVGKSGYGNFNNTFAYVVMYELYKGVVPPGLEIRHICHNKACVNPDHLDVGTKKDNRRDTVIEDMGLDAYREREALIGKVGTKEYKQIEGRIKRKDAAKRYGKQYPAHFLLRNELLDYVEGLSEAFGINKSKMCLLLVDFMLSNYTVEDVKKHYSLVDSNLISQDFTNKQILKIVGLVSPNYKGK